MTLLLATFSLFLFLDFVVVSGYTYKDLRCVVCRATVDEMIGDMRKIKPNMKIQIGGYKVDKEGNLELKAIPYSKSETYLSELMDTVCGKMENFVRATRKDTGEFTLLRLVDENGKMNPTISEVDIIQDSDLNESVKYYCQGLIDEFESEFLDGFINKEEGDDVSLIICGEKTGLCDVEEARSEKMEKYEL